LQLNIIILKNYKTPFLQTTVLHNSCVQIAYSSSCNTNRFATWLALLLAGLSMLAVLHAA